MPSVLRNYQLAVNHFDIPTAAFRCCGNRFCNSRFFERCRAVKIPTQSHLGKHAVLINRHCHRRGDNRLSVLDVDGNREGDRQVGRNALDNRRKNALGIRVARKFRRSHALGHAVHRLLYRRIDRRTLQPVCRVVKNALLLAARYKVRADFHTERRAAQVGNGGKETHVVQGFIGCVDRRLHRTKRRRCQGHGIGRCFLCVRRNGKRQEHCKDQQNGDNSFHLLIPPFKS